MSFANPSGIASFSPRLARQRLPWVRVWKRKQRQRRCRPQPNVAATPLRWVTNQTNLLTSAATGRKAFPSSSFPEAPTYFFSASSTNSNNAFVGGSSGRSRSSLSLLWLVSSRSFQMKFHKVEGFALCRRDLVGVASGQAMFGVGNLMKLKGNAVLHEFLRHQF